MMMYRAKVSAGVKFKEVLMTKQKRDSIVLIGHLLLPTVAAGSLGSQDHVPLPNMTLIVENGPVARSHCKRILKVTTGCTR